MPIGFVLRPALPAILLSSVLAGCALHGGPHAAPGGGRDYGAHGGMGAQGATMDMQAMCDMHRKEMAGKSPAEQRSFMEERMKDMPPEMQQRMKAVAEQCR